MEFNNNIVKNHNNYFHKFKIDNQTVYIEFNEECDKKYKKFYYNIYLIIYNKRKNKNKLFLKSTGEIGLRGLIYARKCVKYFENFILSRWNNIDVNCYMVCRWDNIKRKNVYIYGLKKMGYKISKLDNRKILIKKIK